MEFQEAAINRELQAAREQEENGVQQKELRKEDNEQAALHQPSAPITDESEFEEALGVPARVAKRKSWHMRFGKRGTRTSSEEKPKAGSEGKIVKLKSKFGR
ncbi:hypothetical protein AAVH_01777 [Aphelenchoides avenae]|nr:hypothetical protein AAVH_01777 [Aphelenchus avenae]